MGKVKGLIIDDEAIIALHIALVAKKAGIDQTVLANNSETAIKYFDEEKPDILFVDINLAGQVDGFDLAKLLCNKSAVPVVFISGNSEKDIKGKLTSEKLIFPFDYLVKPIDDLNLIKIIKKMMSKA